MKKIAFTIASCCDKPDLEMTDYCQGQKIQLQVHRQPAKVIYVQIILPTVVVYKSLVKTMYEINTY